jgi:hypothetical protein
MTTPLLFFNIGCCRDRPPPFDVKGEKALTTAKNAVAATSFMVPERWENMGRYVTKVE